MKYQVFVTETAFAEADQHVEFLAKASPEAASELASEFSKLEGLLTEMPFSHPIIPFPGKGEYHKVVINKRYVAIFKIEGYSVYIEMILDARSQCSWLLV
jgi:hypothetical protein